MVLGTDMTNHYNFGAQIHLVWNTYLQLHSAHNTLYCQSVFAPSFVHHLKDIWMRSRNKLPIQQGWIEFKFLHLFYMLVISAIQFRVKVLPATHCFWVALDHTLFQLNIDLNPGSEKLGHSCWILWNVIQRIFQPRRYWEGKRTPYIAPLWQKYSPQATESDK